MQPGSQGLILAIDFGTSNTAAAVGALDGQIYMVRLGAGSDTMPSAILRTANGWLTGDAALRSAVLDPTSFEPSPKRRLADGQVLIGSEFVSAVELVAEVLKAVIEKVRRLTTVPITTVILTHPDRWGTATIHQLKTAALGAGIPESILTFVTEAQAAAALRMQRD